MRSSWTRLSTARPKNPSMSPRTIHLTRRNVYHDRCPRPDVRYDRTMTAVLLFLSIFAAQGTVKPSQHGSVSQEVAGTTLTIEYDRPVARGRELFGALVPYDRIWCPGANQCTTLKTTTEITVEGQKLPAGTYTIWATPGASSWSIVFNTAHPTFHTQHQRVTDKDLLTVEVKPRTASHMETLAFYFSVVDGHHTELVLHWGTVAVPLSIDVP